MRKSQRANHAVMEIQNISVINYNSTGYLCTWRSRGNQIREVVNTIIFRRIHYNRVSIVNSLPPPFSQFRFSRKNLLSLHVYYVEIFNYHPIMKILSRLWCEADYLINRIRNPPPQLPFQSRFNMQ